MTVLVPRSAKYTIGLAAVSLVFLLYLGAQVRPPAYLRPKHGPPTSSTHKLTPIQAKLEHQEDVYYQMVQDRHSLIRKFGPTPEKLQPQQSLRRGKVFLTRDHVQSIWFNCPYETERIGVLGDGGKWACGVSRIKDKPNCVVYSAGISTESSFEAEVLRRTNCTVYGFDFSVRQFGPEVHNYASLRNRTHFYRYGLAGTDNHSGNPPMWTIQALMQKHGHTFIDILKIDIEGAEFDTLKSMINYYKDIGPLPFGQLQLEIHANKITFMQFLRWWEDLEEAGLRPFWTEPNLLVTNWFRGAPAYTEYSFLNIGMPHEILLD
ncbi:hypothetical protein FRC07_002175 [Ceratobasidium sp. 392]|nr:hypothetical protein FRC07_002175 [Ceratobasidium sp. 392]